MPKAKLVTRSASTSSVTTDSIPKGSGLTNAELDSNFLNLRDQGWRVRADDSTQHTVTADTQVNFSGGTITADANGDITVSNLGGSGDIGNLLVNDTTITTVSTDDDLRLETKGTGLIDYDSVTHRFGTGSFSATLTSKGAFDFIISTNQGTNSGQIKIGQGSSGAIELSPSPSGKVVIDGLSYPTADGTNGQVLSTNGSGTLNWVNESGVHTFYDAGTVNQDGGSFTLDADNGNVQLVTGLAANGGSKTINTPTNMSAGDVMRVIIYGGGTQGQDFDLNFNSNFLTYGGSSGVNVIYGRARIFEVTYDGTRYYLKDTSAGSSGYQ